MKYVLVDFSNSFFRARHIASRQADMWTKMGLAIHVTLASVNKAVRDFGADHVVFCLEGRSWRKDFYKPYKNNRREARAAMTDEQAEEDTLFYAAYDDFGKFLIEKTSCSVIASPNAEADDVIARWIALHPADEHVIVSSDSDFHQLISENVTQFNGVTNEHYTLDGVFNEYGKPVIDKKTKQPKKLGDPKWILFEKCMRGDPTDNVFSAYPGVRKVGSKNKVGLTEAFNDKETKGFFWNNLMLQRWVDHEQKEHRVLDEYERNRILIDLSAQPDNIKEEVDNVINETVNTEHVSQVGIHFLKFCGKYDLEKISQQAESYAKWMNMGYKGVLRA